MPTTNTHTLPSTLLSSTPPTITPALINFINSNSPYTKVCCSDCNSNFHFEYNILVHSIFQSQSNPAHYICVCTLTCPVCKKTHLTLVPFHRTSSSPYNLSYYSYIFLNLEILYTILSLQKKLLPHSSRTISPYKYSIQLAASVNALHLYTLSPNPSKYRSFVNNCNHVTCVPTPLLSEVPSPVKQTLRILSTLQSTYYRNPASKFLLDYISFTPAIFSTLYTPVSS